MAVAREELVARARELAPIVRERAGKTEEQRCIPEETFQLFKSAGWKIMFYPDSIVVHHHGGSSRPNPNVAAWSYEAQQRAILRFLRKWKGAPLAYVANLVMLLGLLPRTLVWLLADAWGALHDSRSFRLSESLKARSCKFHLAALCRPSIFESCWAPASVEQKRASDV